MISVSDILKILDKAPIWKTLKETPTRLEALEKRIAELEQKPDVVPGKECPFCGAPAFRLDSKRPLEGKLEKYNLSGGRIETWKCGACGKTDDHFHVPGQ